MTVEEWLGRENQLGTDIWTKKYCNEAELCICNSFGIDYSSGGCTAGCLLPGAYEIQRQKILKRGFYGWIVYQCKLHCSADFLNAS